MAALVAAECPGGDTTAPTTPRAPEAPTIGEATSGNASAKIAFTPPADTGTASISEYTATCSSGSTQVSGTGTASPITVSGLTNGTAYTCSVKAKNAAGSSAASGTVSVTPATTPTAPTITGVTQGIAQLTIAFTAGPNGGSAITGFTATCTASSGSGSATGTISPITVKDLANGANYSCVVVAANALGKSGSSNAFSASTAGAPAAPTIGAATAGNGQLSIAFTAGSSNGSSITAYTATCAAADGTAKTGTGSASPIVVTGLTNGTSYTCSVKAENAIGQGAASATVTGTPVGAPTAPTIGTATAGNGTVSVAFTANGNGGSAITGYTASCAVTGGVTRTATGTTSPISVANLTNGTTYTCSVTATNAAGTSEPSGTVDAKPVGPPPAPTIGTATPGNQTASIAFAAPSSNGGSDITGYTVSCTASATTLTATATASPISVTGMTNGTAYSCTVKATNASGAGTASGAVSVTPRTVPSAPTIGTITAGDAAAIVAFTAGSNGGSAITGYTASCAPTTGGTAKMATGTSSPVTVPQLTNDTPYTCSVTATNAAGTSAASATGTVTPKAAVSTSGVMCPYSYSAINSVALLQSTVSWTCNTTARTMTSTQVPDYPAAKTYTGNPNAISVQSDPAVTFTLTPALTGAQDSSQHIVAWAKNGVKFDPATAEVCPGKSYCTGASGTATNTYNVEAIGQSLFSAGVDNANAHVQPNGAYHYHGMPTKYMKWLASGGTDTTTAIAVQHYLMGFAVDGFPIYAKYGYGTALDATSAVREIKSSWRKKTTGELTAERISFGTSGSFAIGTFTQDFVYDPTGTGGDLDQCNGRFAKTPDFPSGIYAYYITEDFPFIMRCLKGTVPSTGRGGAGSAARVVRPSLGRGRPPRR